MPNPIPSELLAQFSRCFHEIRQRYREQGQGRINWDTTGEIPRHVENGPFIGCGPCEVVGDEFRPLDQPEAIFKPIPEIRAIMEYLEEMP